MRLKNLELTGFKSFYKKTILTFDTPIAAIVGPNGSGKSNVAEAFRWVLGEQSVKSLRGRRGEDLIFNGTGATSHLNRASVSLTFDNRDHKFNLPYEEIILTREVYRDGVNNYLINGSAVRLRDIVELLAAVSLGASGHHIISQGEADRLLGASLLERRSMIEDALGLKIYQWKIGESQRKFHKTEENLRQVAARRQEIAPHLRFLKKEVDKMSKADDLRRDLVVKYLDYFSHLDKYLREEAAVVARGRAPIQAELSRLNEQLKKSEHNDVTKPVADELKPKLEAEIKKLENEKSELVRRLGRWDGLLESKDWADDRVIEQSTLPRTAVEELIKTIRSCVASARAMNDFILVRQSLDRLEAALDNFWLSASHPVAISGRDQADKIRRQQTADVEALRVLDNQLTERAAALAAAESAAAGAAAAEQSALRAVLELKMRRSELAVEEQTWNNRASKLEVDKQNFKIALEEAATVAGAAAIRYGTVTSELSTTELESRRREIEKLKLRLEDMGAPREEVMTEYRETQAREEFLAREVTDLEKSAESLKLIIAELQIKIDREFKRGLDLVNEAFKKFFVTMFGGGTASLVVMRKTKRSRRSDLELLTDEEAAAAASESPSPGGVEGSEVEGEEGVEINVSLPRKKIKSLEMLSGGERALTSIALLFAMSQVNPPPFLILDETDAALDESNSRKYGEMISDLARHSQLILITHNRETMSRADLLYGVTMGGDGVSKLLSIKFDDAQAYAKQ